MTLIDCLFHSLHLKVTTSYSDKDFKEQDTFLPSMLISGALFSYVRLL